MEKKNYKYKVGDKVILVDDEKRDLSPACYDFITSRSYFIVKDVIVKPVKTKSGEIREGQFLDFGFTRKVKDKVTNETIESNYLYPAFRFRPLDPSEIDWDDPYGEETFEVNHTFEQKVKKDEEEAKQTIAKNITKTWIDSSFRNVVKVVSIKENMETYRYDIKYNTFKTKEKNELDSAKSFISSFTLLSEESIPKMEEQLENKNNKYKENVNRENDRFKQKVKELEDELKYKIDDLTKSHTNEVNRINSIINMCKNQK